MRSIYAAWERGDYSSAKWAHPEIECVVVDGPSPGKWAGLAGMAEAAGDRINAWVDFRVEPYEYRELDNERVLVLQRLSGRGRTSGVDLGQIQGSGATLYHVRDGRVTGIVDYWDRDRALADLGLAPESGSR